MKDSFDIAEDMYSLINVPQATSLIDGGIYLHSRPSNSGNTDIVVRVIAGTNDWMQNAVVAINLDGAFIPGTRRPDQLKMREIGRILTEHIENQYRATFFTEIENPAQIRKDTDGSSYLNIRVRYRSIQDNFKNI
jgi:hypothetical protein